MKLGFTPIEYGDCITVEWIDSHGFHHLGILDGGSVSSYKNYLRNFLQSLSIPIDFWVISHAHRDHIGGVLRYLENVHDGYPLPLCKCWITNFELKTTMVNCFSDDGSKAESVIQGNKVVSYLSQIKNCNVVNNLHTGMQIPFEGLTMSIVTSPKANDEYEIEKDTVAATSSGTDYNVALSEFDLTNFEEDTNLTNASSLSVIVESEGKRFLWLSDSIPSQYVPALKYIKEQTNDSLSFEIASLAHHGSNGNTNMDYLSIINCEKYLITANAENIHNLPNKETLSRIIMNPIRNVSKHLEFIFPMDNSTLRHLFEVDGKNIEERHNFSCNYGCRTLTI